MRRVGSLVAGAAVLCACSIFGEDSATPAASTPDDASTADAGVEDSAAADASSGTPVVLADNQIEGQSIAATETTVFWTEVGSSTIRSVDIRGGEAMNRTSVTPAPRDIVVSGDQLLWRQGTAVRRAPVDLKTASAVIIPDPEAPTAIAANANRVAYTASDMTIGSFDIAGGGKMGRGPEANPTKVAAWNGNGYWLNGTSVRRMTFSNVNDISDLPLDGHTCTSIAANNLGVFVACPPATVGAVFTNNPQTFITVSAAEDSPRSIWTDQSSVYWLTGNGQLRRLSPASSPITMTEGFQVGTSDGPLIATTTDYVVWVAKNRILRLPK